MDMMKRQPGDCPMMKDGKCSMMKHISNPRNPDKMEKVMHEYKIGSLKSSSGAPVKGRKQAIAIGLSEARKAGQKVPKKRGY